MRVLVGVSAIWLPHLILHLMLPVQLSATTPGTLVLAAFAEASKPSFPLQTQGRWVVGSDGKRVKLACVNWSGGEAQDGVVGGLHYRPVASIAETFKEMGFNCVRLPWSVWMVQTNQRVAPQHLDAVLGANPELKTKTALEIFDAVVNACANVGLMVIIDNHMSDGDWCCSDLDENGLWYNTRWSEAEWISAHVTMAKRYARQPWVVGTELRNEVRNSVVNGIWRSPHWGGGGQDDWHAAATRAGNAVMSVNPHLLVIVGGLAYNRDLTGVFKLPVQLKVPNRVVYGAHCYAWTYPGLPNNYEALKEKVGHDWGYIVEENRPYTAPVWISEFGTFSDCHKDSCKYWWPDFLRYLEEGDFDWAVWHGDGTYSRVTVPGHPFNGATNYGVLSADWRTPANGGELMRTLQTLEPPSRGPGVASQSKQCDMRCEDTWDSGWSNGRVNAAACTACLRSPHCRGGVTIEEWCSKQWTKLGCGWTCCRANIIAANTCGAARCDRGQLSDSWDPSWSDGKMDSAACLHCIRDDNCRQQHSPADWCKDGWASQHCALTCCKEGYSAPRLGHHAANSGELGQPLLL